MNKITPSALTMFSECFHKYRLTYVDKVSEWKSSIALVFGKAAHEAVQVALQKKDAKIANEIFFETFDKFFEKEKDKLDLKETLRKDELIQDGKNIFTDFHKYVDFSGLEDVECEETLVEQINDDWTFSGRLDIVYKTKNKYHIIDIKTSKASWTLDKRDHLPTKSQLLLYKHFWCRKHNVEPTKVLTEFMILKKKVPNKPIDVYKISSGEKSVGRSVNLMNHAIKMIESGKFFKSFNKNVCKWCEFNNTEYCIGDKTTW